MIQKRNIGLAILFTFITFGIYGIYWLVKITDEANELSGGKGTTGVKALLLTIVTFGIYNFFWNYNMGKTMYAAQEQAGVTPKDNAVLYLILSLFQLTLVSYILIQSDINALVEPKAIAIK